MAFGGQAECSAKNGASERRGCTARDKILQKRTTDGTMKEGALSGIRGGSPDDIRIYQCSVGEYLTIVPEGQGL